MINMPRRLLAMALILVLVSLALGADAPEASRVRILIAVDTDDQMGATWGLDGANLKVILEAAAKKQSLGDRVTIDTFTGKQVTADNILAYYANLPTGPT